MSKQNTTSDRWLKKPGLKKQYDKEYRTLVLSEIFHAMKENDPKSIRALATEIGMAKSVVQDISTGKQQDIKLSNFRAMAHAFGFNIVLENQDMRIAF